MIRCLKLLPPAAGATFPSKALDSTEMFAAVSQTNQPSFEKRDMAAECSPSPQIDALSLVLISSEDVIRLTEETEGA